MAARLSEDPSRHVLLLEAGPDYHPVETPAAVRGGDFIRALALPGLHWPKLLARLTEWQRPRSYYGGRGVGGSSVINGQSAVRGLPGDFERWATDGCASWMWDDVLPAFRRLEDDLDHGCEPYHGVGGPLPVSRTAQDAWGAASRALGEAATDIGHPAHPDLNAPASSGISPVAWNRRNGSRVSTKDAYLEPARGRRNLRIMANTLGVKAQFSRRRLTGVDVSTPDGCATIAAQHAVLCAGALHSPAFLLRSGIGPAEELRALDIPVVSDVPGVGRNLQDHPVIWLTFPLNVSGRVRSRDTLPGHSMLRFSSGVHGAAPDDLQLYACDRAGKSLGSGGLMVALLEPRSTGRVMLRSSAPTDEPDIQFRMLSDHDDVSRMSIGVREAMLALRHRAFRSIVEGPALLGGVPGDELDSAELTQALRAACASYNHATGTCRMGSPCSDETVVDERGSVLGVQGLSVADASLMPRIVRAPTHLTTVMFAEHIARFADLTAQS